MKHIKYFNNLNPYDRTHKNEGINFKKALVGTAIAGVVGAGIYNTAQISGKAKLSDTEVVSGIKFNQYLVYVMGETFNLNISDDGIITSYWSEQKGTGDDKTTVYYNSITITPDIKKIWYKTKMDMENGLFASKNKIKDGTEIDIKNLKISEETSTYIIYETPFFSSVDHIIVNKGHKSGEEFSIEGKYGKWFCDNIDNTYLFGVKSLGNGKFGGAGSFEEW